MGRIVRLNEREFDNLIKKIIIESRRFNSQEVVDKILDKISSQGLDSLTDKERYILNNPDEEFEMDDSEDDYDESYFSDIINEIIEKGLVKKENLSNEDEDVYVVTSIETEDDTELPYFFNDSLVFYVDDENKVLTIDFDAQELSDEVMEVFNYIVNVWEPQLPDIKINIELNR